MAANDIRYRINDFEGRLKRLEVSMVKVKTTLDIEVKHLIDGNEKVLHELKNVERRLSKMEAILEIERQDTRAGASLTLLETIGQYWHIVALISSVFCFLLAYFFHIRIKD